MPAPSRLFLLRAGPSHRPRNWQLPLAGLLVFTLSLSFVFIRATRETIENMNCIFPSCRFPTENATMASHFSYRINSELLDIWDPA